ncbi:hypothetical protein PISL3812_01076 [Talaromyces islandicus]|uniref:Uncharacterized protein n=1 Tax=Talaromyces islandicus TaxID=28573 RepID=A0A0U1LNK6_TALIS|nr:hypothetical protein PISL3812_01076 [Talaromyces islandicus]
MRLFLALAVFLISAVVAFTELPSKSESGCRASKTGHALCLQSLGGDANEDFNDAQQPAVMVTHNPVHQKQTHDSIYTTQQQQSNFESVPVRRWLATSMSATGLGFLKEKLGATWTVRSRIKARSEGALGQTPWYGMALGLMCTTLAAVMLG